MCGIAGYWLLDGSAGTDQVIADMVASMRHRGPDDEGFVLLDTGTGKESEKEHDLALANARLSILDLSRQGHQPMSSQDGTVTLVYNGEIYNYLELRDELKKKGHSFVSDTDTEVVIAAYQEYGLDCLQHFNGMWGFVLYDREKNTLFCARDRFGIKPFYYHKSDTQFVFGSEIKTLCQFPLPSITPNEQKMMRNLVQGYRYVDDDDESYFKEIKQLEPATYMLIDLTSKDCTITKYWELDLTKQTDLSDEEIVAKYRELLIDAVKIRLRADVPYTFALSGGMDSPSIVSIAKKVLKKETITFSAVYEKGNRYDEQEYIQAVIDDLGIDSHFIKPTLGDFFANLTKMISYHDEPICTVTFYSHWQVMQKIKDEGFTVVLTGNGADESASGYYDHYWYNFYDLEKTGETELMEKEITLWMQNHNKERKLWTDFRKKLDSTSFLSPNKEKHQALIKDELLATLHEHEHPHKAKSLLTSRMYNELTMEGVPVLLRPEDRNTMAFSLEARVPYLDYRLVEFAYSIPNRFKVRDGIGKNILRDAMKGIVNEKVRTRKEKVGFNAPLYEWMKNELREEIETLLKDKDLGIYDYVKQDVLLGYWKEHLADEDNHMMLFWNLLNFEYWLRYVDLLRSALKKGF